MCAKDNKDVKVTGHAKTNFQINFFRLKRMTLSESIFLLVVFHFLNVLIKADN